MITTRQVIFILFLCLTLNSSMLLVAQPQSWEYLFIQFAEGKMFLRSVNPIEENEITTYASFPSQIEVADQGIFSLNANLITLSPNRRYIALPYTHLDWRLGTHLQIGEIATGNVTEVIYSKTEINQVEWSPDNSILAFDANLIESIPEDIFLYYTALGRGAKLTEDLNLQLEFAISPNSQSIVVYSVTNPGTEDRFCVNCGTDLRIYSLASPVDAPLIDLSPLMPLVEIYPSELICNLDWSPDGQHITFVTECPTMGKLPWHHEIYMVNVGQPALNSITPYTALLTSHKASYFYADYHLDWYDANSLFMGIEVNQGYIPADNPAYPTPNPPLRKVVIYNPAIDQSTVLIDNQIVHGLDTAPSGSYLAFTDENDTLKIASYQNGDLGNTQDLEFKGCELDWSPDSAILKSGVMRTNPTLCTDQIVFFDVITQQIHSFDPQGTTIYLEWVKSMDIPKKE